MQTALIIYFVINSFIAGYNYSENVNWAKKTHELISAHLVVCISFLFGVLIIIFKLLLIPKALFWKYINETFQISFFFDFYFLNKYKTVEKEILEHLNRVSYLRKTTNSIRDRIYRRGVKLINRKNNYTYIHKNNF